VLVLPTLHSSPSEKVAPTTLRQAYQTRVTHLRITLFNIAQVLTQQNLLLLREVSRSAFIRISKGEQGWARVKLGRTATLVRRKPILPLAKTISRTASRAKFRSCHTWLYIMNVTTSTLLNISFDLLSSHLTLFYYRDLILIYCYYIIPNTKAPAKSILANFRTSHRPGSENHQNPHHKPHFLL